MSLRILGFVVVAICAFSTGIAGAQQCGDAADLTCNGSCAAGSACDVSQSGIGCECVPGQPLAVKKLSIKLNFAKSGADGVNLQATIPVPAGFRPEGLQVSVDVGGVVRDFTLDAKPKGVAELDRTQLKVKFQNGDVPTQDARLLVKFVKGTFSDQLVDEQLTSRTVKDDPVQVLVNVTVGGKLYTQTVAKTYTAKTGKSGKAK